MMRLLLARHGNTFEAGEMVVWVGARTDLPLTQKGKEQAAALALALKRQGIMPSRIVCGPLLRTREHAAIVSEMLGVTAPEIDERLKEIDYGLWEGKSSEEIRAAFPQSTLDAWNRHGVWPEGAGWSPDPATTTESVTGLASEIAASASPDELVLLVTSNGILKFFPKLVPGAFEAMAEKDALKVATGRVCLLRGDSSRWEVQSWNLDPAQLIL